jgi:hypothetical protein
VNRLVDQNFELGVLALSYIHFQLLSVGFLATVQKWHIKIISSGTTLLARDSRACGEGESKDRPHQYARLDTRECPCMPDGASRVHRWDILAPGGGRGRGWRWERFVALVKNRSEVVRKRSLTYFGLFLAPLSLLPQIRSWQAHRAEGGPAAAMRPGL